MASSVTEVIKVVDDTWKGYNSDPVQDFLKKEMAGVTWNN